MPTEEIIGEVKWVNLVINRDSDLTFEVRWWADQAKTDPIDFTGVESIVEEDGNLIVDLDSYSTITTNSCVIHVPAADLSALNATSSAKWRFTGVSATERRRIVEGHVRIQ